MKAALDRFAIPALVGCWLLGYWAPWRAPGGSSNVWLMLASWAAAHVLADLAKSSAIVTAAIAGVAVLGAGLRLGFAVRPRAGQVVARTGLVLTCAPLCVLLPRSGAAFFLLAVIAVAFTGGRNARTLETSKARGLWQRLAKNSFPVLSAVCFSTMSWQYNAQWLLQGLLVSAGLALLVVAVLPSTTAR